MTAIETDPRTAGMPPEVAKAMETIRSLVGLHIRLHPDQTKRQRRQVVAQALPIVMGEQGCLAFAYDHLISVVVDEEVG